ncbi:MAG TPA: FHA domain-containing protein, partial [Pseudobdellovibrionaceae bacterium]|nr:FHA domain-containing protein [Pseudobdellovibrionaceae bacterium]
MEKIYYLEGLEGPLAGGYYLLENGTTFGRSQGDIILKDSKVSTSHAKVVVDAAGRYFVLDLDSGNGLFLGDQRVKKVSLLSGVVFQIGRSAFKVHEGAIQDIERLGIIRPWRSRLISLLENVTLKDDYIKGNGLPFIPAIKLEFIQGIQLSQSETFYYGPRMVGQKSLDLELLDPKAPEKAFLLIPQGRSAKIKIFDSQKVLINNQPLKEHNLREGDIIGFGSSLIQVSYV